MDHRDEKSHIGDLADAAYRDRARFPTTGKRMQPSWSVPMRRCAVRDVLFYLSVSGARDKAVTAYQQSVGEWWAEARS